MRVRMTKQMMAVVDEFDTIECELEYGKLIVKPIVEMTANTVLCEVSGFRALEGREYGQLHFERYENENILRMKVTDDE